MHTGTAWVGNDWMWFFSALILSRLFPSGQRNMPGILETLKLSRRPRCFINTGADGKLQVDAGLLGELELLDKPLVVVAIAGLYRTGKSYLMNRLAGKGGGESRVFPLEPSFQYHDFEGTRSSSCNCSFQDLPWGPPSRVRPRESGSGFAHIHCLQMFTWCC